MTTTHRAARYPGEKTIMTACTGICGTDLHIAAGGMDARVSLPAVIGHETDGRVTAVGEGVSGWSPGDPVTVVPLRPDGTCPACRAGNGHVCEHMAFLGIDGPGGVVTVLVDCQAAAPGNTQGGAA